MRHFFIYPFLISFLFFSCQTKKKDVLMIATAANMQFAVKELVKNFATETGINCQTVISSSGKLTAQIKAGAPFHVFLSANMKYPNELFRENLTIDTHRIYTYGQLVLWTTKNNIQPNINQLNEANIQHIALANPKTAPYGEAAIQVLKHYDLFEKVEKKLVYGESIAQTNQFITTQAAEIGFTSKSVVQALKLEKQGKWVDISTDFHQPIEQGIVILKNKNVDQIENAKRFQTFLFSEKGQLILKKFY